MIEINKYQFRVFARRSIAPPSWTFEKVVLNIVRATMLRDPIVRWPTTVKREKPNQSSSRLESDGYAAAVSWSPFDVTAVRGVPRRVPSARKIRTSRGRHGPAPRMYRYVIVSTIITSTRRSPAVWLPSV
jgi:hypothetical protein